jgi:uncharacterized protein (TIGR02145 family)
MKGFFKILRIISFIVSLILIHSCEKIEVSSAGTVTDADGNTYDAIKIGKQVWIAENMKTTKFNDGTDIPMIADTSEWRKITTPAYCWYNNDLGNETIYGALYNGYTITTGNLCPVGWHVPTETDWTIFTDYLGGERLAGDKMKETGISHWMDQNNTATNESGFTALPGGYRDSHGKYNLIGLYGIMWSSTEWSSNSLTYREIYSFGGKIVRNINSKTYGFSVRCLKD